MYTEGSPVVQQNNQTALVYFKNAADKVRYMYLTYNLLLRCTLGEIIN